MDVLTEFAAWKDSLIASQLPSILIKVTQTRQPTLYSSKLGGAAAMPTRTPFPTNHAGSPMMLLAQINFKELPPNEIYPSTGLLQFFISTDEFFGKSYKHLRFSDFKVLMHQWLDESQMQERQLSLSLDDEEEVCRPIEGEYALDFQSICCFPNPTDIRFKQLIDDSIFKTDGIFNKERYNHYFRSTKIGHQLGGYGFFIQGDPRERYSEYKDFIILLQLDSDQHVQWGDSGTAQFLIHPEDLARKDFSKIVYYWSCF